MAVLFCEVTAAGEIRIPRPLPRVIYDADRAVDPAALTDTDRRRLGLYPYQRPEFDPSTQRLSGLVLVDDHVTSNVIDLPASEARQKISVEIQRLDQQLAAGFPWLVKFLIGLGVMQESDIPQQLRETYLRRQQLAARLQEQQNARA